MKRVFVTDCEGPISKNDNAYEICSHFVPDGDRLFSVISRYDDALAEVMRRPGYNAGGTLVLVLPFLKAYQVTDKKIKQFSARNLVLIPNVKDSLKHVMSIAPSYIVSTSYEHYLRTLCQAIDFPFKNTYCTKLNLDRYKLTRVQKTQLKQIAQEVAKFPVLEIPAGAKDLDDLPLAAQRTLRELDHIFWKIIAEMPIGRIYSRVYPMGGQQKAEALMDIVRKLSAKLAGVMYVGDSITDEAAFRLVKRKDGLAVSFNGNQYAVKNADIALLSHDSMVIAVIAEIFVKLGKKATLQLLADWSHETLQESSVNLTLLDRFFDLYPRELPKARIVTEENSENLSKESGQFRKTVRGVYIGRLG